MTTAAVNYVFAVCIPDSTCCDTLLERLYVVSLSFVADFQFALYIY
jgi:hypothetical protein